MKTKLVSLFVLLAALSSAILYFTDSLPWKPNKEADVHLSASIEMVRAEHGDDDPIHLLFSLTNEADHPQTVLTWHTPLEGIHSDMFNIELDGEQVEYINKHLKRGSPDASHFVTMAPGETITAVINLEHSHAVHEAGEYTVHLDTAILHYGPGTPEELAQQEQFNPHTIHSEPIQYKLVQGRTPHSFTDGRTIENCTSNELWTANEAMDIGLSMVVRAETVLENSTARKAPLEEWFGTTSTANVNTIKSNFASIRTVLGQSIELFCDRSTSHFAYVRSADHKIYLGKEFWDAPMTGIDSKAGTIIHEVSHFNNVANTDDLKYGIKDVKALADSSPNDAIKNAETYEYFAESMPIYYRWRILSGANDWTTIGRSFAGLSLLRVDNPYSFGKLCKDGSHDDVQLTMDFNGDGKRDVFTVWDDGTWAYSSAGSNNWTTLNISAASIENLRFGDFNGDGKTDLLTKLGDELNVSYGGQGSWHSINSTSVKLEHLRFGDFNGDGKTDVFAKFDKQMKYISGGQGGWINLGQTSIPVENLRFGDFNGDGKTDVFTVLSTGWNYLSGGSGSWIRVNTSSVSLDDLRFGDFDGDCKTDVFAKFGRDSKYSSAAEGSWVHLTTTGLLLEDIRFGDFDADDKTDIFAVFTP
jgi:hypothetical protein